MSSFLETYLGHTYIRRETTTVMLTLEIISLASLADFLSTSAIFSFGAVEEHHLS